MCVVVGHGCGVSLPVSISLSALGILYSSGFINPSDGLPAARRLSLTREKTPAAVGLAQEVPATPIRSEPSAQTAVSSHNTNTTHESVRIAQSRAVLGV
eukprot:COSAG06_NODE_5186_length_3650_cov_2.878941_3_plen_99_part_00